MKVFFILIFISCSHFEPEQEFKTSPKLPPAIPSEKIPKPKDDMSAAIDQTKSYFCIKFGSQFKDGKSCENHSENLHQKCIKRFKNDNKVLDCLVKSLKI